MTTSVSTATKIDRLSDVFHPARLRARGIFTSALARCLTDPNRTADDLSEWIRDREIFIEAWAVFSDHHRELESSALGLGELTPDQALAAAVHSYLQLDKPRREAVHQLIFGLVTCPECPPYETEFCHWADPTYRAQQLADIAGFYSAFGLEIGGHTSERIDHVSHHLEFIAFLTTKLEHIVNNEDALPEHLKIVNEGLTHFIEDHIAWWIPTFAVAVERKADALIQNSEATAKNSDLHTFRDVARCLRAWAACTRIDCGVAPSRRIIAPQVLGIVPEEEETDCGGCQGMG